MALRTVFAVIITTHAANTGKSSVSKDPIIRYCADNSLRLDRWQRELIVQTDKHFNVRWMGAPEVVQLNQNLIRAIGAKNVLDVGLFTGYSALGAALAIPPNGKVIGMDITDQYYSKVGRGIANAAGVGNKIRTFFRPAAQTMQELIRNGTAGQWDFCFIDADKGNQQLYYEQCLTLLRPGGIITIDNVLYGGSVVGPSLSGNSAAVDRTNKFIKADQRVFLSMLPIADGLTIVLKK